MAILFSTNHMFSFLIDLQNEKLNDKGRATDIFRIHLRDSSKTQTLIIKNNKKLS
jgi:hypothetical protein